MTTKDKSNSTEPANDASENNCAKCNKNPCVCSNNSHDSHQETKNSKNSQGTKPPKISWI